MTSIKDWQAEKIKDSLNHLPIFFGTDPCYFPTGLTGWAIKTGEPSAEYEALGNPGERVWLTASGEVMED